MMTIIHGSDIAKGRQVFIDLRTTTPGTPILQGDRLSPIDLQQALSGGGLFGDQLTIYIEELLSKRKPSKELDALISLIVSSSQTIVLWESKDLTPKQISLFPKADVKQFKIPTVVFAFTESIAPQSSKKSLTLFHELLQYEDAAFALAMLQRQVRILLALRSPSVNREPTNSKQSNISEVSRLAPWQMGKLKKQAGMFSEKQLIAIHSKLYEIELGQKTGILSLSLDQAIDFLLLSI